MASIYTRTPAPQQRLFVGPLADSGVINAITGLELPNNTITLQDYTLFMQPREHAPPYVQNILEQSWGDNYSHFLGAFVIGKKTGSSIKGLVVTVDPKQRKQVDKQLAYWNFKDEKNPNEGWFIDGQLLLPKIGSFVTEFLVNEEGLEVVKQDEAYTTHVDLMKANALGYRHDETQHDTRLELIHRMVQEGRRIGEAAQTVANMDEGTISSMNPGMRR